MQRPSLSDIEYNRSKRTTKRDEVKNSPHFSQTLPVALANSCTSLESWSWAALLTARYSAFPSAISSMDCSILRVKSYSMKAKCPQSVNRRIIVSRLQRFFAFAFLPQGGNVTSLTARQGPPSLDSKQPSAISRLLFTIPAYSHKMGSSQKLIPRRERRHIAASLPPEQRAPLMYWDTEFA